MIDLRPVGYVIGLLVAILGATMLLPMLADLGQGRGHWPVFLESSLLTLFVGHNVFGISWITRWVSI